MKVKNRRRRQGALRFPVSFLIHRCRWGCNSSTSSRSSDVIRDSLIDSLSQDSNFQDTVDLLPENNAQNDHSGSTSHRSHDPDAELLLGATSGGENDSDQENETDAQAMNPHQITSNQNQNPSPSPKDTHDNNARPNRRRTLQEVFQIDIQSELQRQPLTEVPENQTQTHPLYNFNRNLLSRQRPGTSRLAVQVNPLFNLNDRLGRNNPCSPTSLIAHFMQSSQRSSEESDSSLRLGDADIDIFRSEGQSFDSLPRDLPDDQNSNVSANNQTNNADNAENSTIRTSLQSSLAENYSANLENVRFDFPHRMIALPTSGWLNNRLSRGVGNQHSRPRRQVSNESRSTGSSSRNRINNAISYEINPLTVQQDSDNNSVNSNTGSRSSRNSSQSSGSNRVPTQQNWYFYDSRLTPGNQQNRVTIESNFRGVNTQFDVPNILSPPAYDEIGPSQGDHSILQNGDLPYEPPPPYSDGGSDTGIRPQSFSYSNQSIEGEPPPAYEQSFHHQLGEFSNLPRDPEDNDIDSELSDSLSSSVHLDDDIIPTDEPCQAILDNFVLVAGSPRQNQTTAESRGPDIPSPVDRPNLASSLSPGRPSSPSLPAHGLNSSFMLSPSPNNNRPVSPSQVTLEDFSNAPANPADNTTDPFNIFEQRNIDNDLEDQTDDANVREFFPPPITARSVFGGRPALRWSRNTSINRWMNTIQPWQL